MFMDTLWVRWQSREIWPLVWLNIESAKLDWIIQGPVENRLINNYLYYGAEHNNRIATLKLNNTLDGISSYITDYTEFVN